MDGLLPDGRRRSGSGISPKRLRSCGNPKWAHLHHHHPSSSSSSRSHTVFVLRSNRRALTTPSTQVCVRATPLPVSTRAASALLLTWKEARLAIFSLSQLLIRVCQNDRDGNATQRSTRGDENEAARLLASHAVFRSSFINVFPFPIPSSSTPSPGSTWTLRAARNCRCTRRI